MKLWLCMLAANDVYAVPVAAAMDASAPPWLAARLACSRASWCCASPCSVLVLAFLCELLCGVLVAPPNSSCRSLTVAVLGRPKPWEPQRGRGSSERAGKPRTRCGLKVCSVLATNFSSLCQRLLWCVPASLGAVVARACGRSCHARTVPVGGVKGHGARRGGRGEQRHPSK